eukprot:8112299-Pyramimonas_sp.AAC.1
MREKARLSWPLPLTTPEGILAEIQQIRAALAAPSSTALERVRCWAWRQAGDASIQSICYALAITIVCLVPIACAWGTANRIKEFMVVELFVSLAIPRLRAECRRDQFPKWL